MDKALLVVVYVFFLAIGLTVGSFINVLIYRLPREMSIAFPASHCPECKTRIRWYDNIPLLSYIVLRGRCRGCGAKISARYPLVEFLNPLLWLLLLIKFGVTLNSLCYCLAVSAFIALFFIDLEHQIIPDSLNAFVALLGLVLTIFARDQLWWERLAGGLGAAALFLMLMLVFKAILKRDALGMGDLKFVAAAGLLVGWKLIALAIGAAAVIACVSILTAGIAKKIDLDKPFAFGTFLVTGTTLAVFFGGELIDWYLSLF